MAAGVGPLPSDGEKLDRTLVAISVLIEAEFSAGEMLEKKWHKFMLPSLKSGNMLHASWA